jgi:hypothetical protein
MKMFSHDQEPNGSSMLQRNDAGPCRVDRSARCARAALLLGLMAAGCGDRYQLGETAQTLDDAVASPGLDTLAVLIANGAEDADGVTTHAGPFHESRSVGDVDADGYDDWVYTFDIPELVYGGPRGPAGTFRDADTTITAFPVAGAADGHTDWNVRGAGDVNGDGHADLFFVGRVGASEHGPMPHSYLWYGGPERAREVDLDVAAVVFDDPEQSVVWLAGIGDIDADGYDDFGCTYELSDPAQQTGPSPVETSTYVYYGSPERLPANGSSVAPAARLLATARVDALGDVDGDGYPEFQASGPQRVGATATSLLRGAAGRLSGDVDVFGSGIPIGDIDGMTAVQAAGDLDRDGYDDFIVTRIGYDDVETYLFHADLSYGGPDRLNAPFEPEFADARFAMDNVPADLRPVGDWNGDGYADLGLQQKVLRGDTPCLDCFSDGNPLWTGEARIIPGTAERYAGSYATTTLRPDLELRDPDAPSGPTHIAPLGDIDGDGFSDLALRMETPHSARMYIKYGGPLRSTLR